MDALGSVSASFLSGFSVSAARLAYLDICDVCKTLTKAFQTQLFINIVGNVFGITFMMLSAFNTLMSDGANTIRITLYFLYESLIRTLQMYFIIDACHTTVEQVPKTIKIYHNNNIMQLDDDGNAYIGRVDPIDFINTYYIRTRHASSYTQLQPI